MSKRMTALFMAVLLPIALIFTGCGKRLTAEEYRDELQSRIKDYASALTEIAMDIQAFDESGVKPSDFEEHSKTLEKAIKNLEKIKPPADMDSKHKWFLEAFDYERKWLAAVRELMSTKTSAEKEQAIQKIQDIANAAVQEKAFLARYVEIVKELPRDTGG